MSHNLLKILCIRLTWACVSKLMSLCGDWQRDLSLCSWRRGRWRSAAVIRLCWRHRAVCTQTCGTHRTAETRAPRAGLSLYPSACRRERRSAGSCRRRSSTAWRAAGTAPAELCSSPPDLHWTGITARSPGCHFFRPSSFWFFHNLKGLYFHMLTRWFEPVLIDLCHLELLEIVFNMHMYILLMQYFWEAHCIECIDILSVELC